VDGRDKPGHDGTEVDDDATNPGLTRACALPKIGATDMTDEECSECAAASPSQLR